MLKVIEHPIIKIKLTKMRDKESSHSIFRTRLNEIASLMLYEILRDYKSKSKKVITPLNQEYNGFDYDKEIVFVPILRAGLGMVDGLLNLIREAKVGHIGLYRDEKTHKPHSYFYKMPEVAKDSYIFIIDPMLATGNSAVDAIKKIQKDGFNNISLVCLVGCNEGVQNVEKSFGKDFKIYLASLDERLNDQKYIEPGLGDAGDRIFGTK
ncbi:uracil phosphoribosyltransferase [Metamycoplasma subdolum]|uniref:Uracil phosphoribosyltransferase n=1 Tax=Metamycoplasma subdolum TaxID=92407 RepID=A0A3L9ZZ67_9BACT|nr:uracil phosphoribosyltransferase [Metamycoplasma subdolum]RMA77424.1 uracil phosphoribosyltransferase [Metamycoplasma subdolum]WPB50399.1 uracil phosphoribosyltransferase [Metamycoplasma subdolum]